MIISTPVVVAMAAKKCNNVTYHYFAPGHSISDHISKALKDNEISDEEFTLIISEIDKYNQMMEDIRNKIKSKLDEETKESLIKQGKEKAIEEFSIMFNTHGKVGSKAV
jgi:hypothetical protein